MATRSSATPARPFRPALLLVLMLPVALFFAPLTIILLASLTPTLAARLLDTGRPPYLTITVGCANLIGSIYFVDMLRSIGMDIENVGIVLRDPLGWMAVLGTAGVGWVVFLCSPIVVQAMAQVQSATRMRRMRRAQQKLIDAWGNEVSDENEE